MEIEKVAAFASGIEGGNPAGVVVTSKFPTDSEMLKIATEVGFSETVFAVPQEDSIWRVRYFAPLAEIPFCGHATIALGSVLNEKFHLSRFQLILNDGEISVDIKDGENGHIVSFLSPPTKSNSLSGKLVSETLDLFGYSRSQLDPKIEPAQIHAGSNHILIALSRRDDLSAMEYLLDEGREFMQAHGLVTIMLVWRENDKLFHVRNAFAAGGVVEDPATGAAAAAFSGYLRDINWPHKNELTLIQGVDMNVPCVIYTEFSDEYGSPIKVSGSIRSLTET